MILANITVCQSSYTSEEVMSWCFKQHKLCRVYYTFWSSFASRRATLCFGMFKYCFPLSRKKYLLVIVDNLIYGEFRTNYGYPSPFQKNWPNYFTEYSWQITANVGILCTTICNSVYSLTSSIWPTLTTIVNQSVWAKPNMEMGGSLCWWDMETITSSKKSV